MSYRNPNVENPQDQVYPPRYPQQQRPPYQSQGSQFQPRQGYEQRSSYPPKEPYASSPNQAPPNQQGGRFEGILQQIMDGQKRNTKEMYEKMDTLFSNLNTKYDAVATHVKKLETQVTQTMEAVKRQEAESKKSFCNSAAIEERFEDQVPEWMLSKPTVDCMIWPEENYPERESNRARKRRLFPKIIPKTDNSGKFVCLVSSKIGNCSIPTDFQIVEMRESSHRPLIFGTPFLSTVGAIFDFPNQRISFNKVNKGMFFPMCSTKNSFVDMVQEEKVTLKPPQEGETEETIKEDPIPKPKQLAKQARSKTKAPTPKPPKGSTKIEDEAKPRRRLESLDRIEGEKGVKTQSAPKHWPRTRKRILAEQFSWPTVTVEPGRNSSCSAGLLYCATETVRAARTNREETSRDRPKFSYRNGPTVPVDPGNNDRPRPKSLGQTIWPTKSLDRDKSAIGQNFSRPRYTMAKTKGNESMKKKKNPFMEPPKKQIKLGSSSSNARAAIPTSPHSIDANQEHVESPRRGEDDWALVTFVGEQNQDPRKCKKAMEKVNIEPCVKMDTQTLDLLKIRDDVTWYIRKLGLSKLFKLECSEYSQLTRSFSPQ
ncbi:unnamed protein product [Microthlaspi erraticum]|uniref:Retrotransposon gag domain-containing protein n=1 Tax=Microthlaspi erraticum TaxID=1685480 RepID=A0A6D2KDZ7_9BRAS|nr:unnamed protein product [Microthlaspi erraticum]